jgi:hypothetical protein
MNPTNKPKPYELGPRLESWPLPGKALVTIIVLMTAIGFAGALSQIIVHDIIPTFWGEKKSMVSMADDRVKDKFTRGDIFSTIPAKKKTKWFYETDEFIFALKFTHIHIFGMSAIFAFMGLIVLFLDLGVKARAWLIILPFVGVIIDLLSVWLKIFIHPGFFWLHIPGGVLFGAVFIIDTILIIWQMWSYQLIKEN